MASSKSQFNQSTLTNMVRSPIFEQLVQKPIVDRSIRRFEYKMHYDTDGSLDNKMKTNFRFKHQIGDKPTIVGKSYVEFKYRIGTLTPDRVFTPLAADDPTTVGANPLWLFNKVTLNVNGRKMEELIEPGLMYQVKSRFEIPEAMIESTGKTEGFIPDRGNGICDKDQYILTNDGATPPVINGVENNPDYNKGYHDRWETTKGSAWVTVKIELDRLFEFCTQYKLPMIGIPIELELVRNTTPNQFINTAKTNSNPATRHRCWPAVVNNPNWPADQLRPTREYTVEISKLTWWIPSIEPSPAINAWLYDLMKEENRTNILYSNSRLISGPDFAGTNSIRWNIDNLREIPTDVSIVFVDSRAFNGNPSESLPANPNIFEHINISSINLNVGHVRYPDVEYKTIFPPKVMTPVDVQHFYDKGGEDYLRLYRDFLESARSCSGKACLESTVTYSDFKKHCTIFHFDLAYIDTAMFNNNTAYTLGLDATIDKAATDDGLPNSFRAYAIISTERLVVLEMSSDSRTLFDFPNE